MHAGYGGPPRDAAALARRALRALGLLALVSLAAAGAVWLAVAGRGAADSPGGLALAVVAGAALALPGLLLAHLARTLARAGAALAELRERPPGDPSWAGDRRLFARSLRLAMRERGVGLLAAPWYWLLALWALAASCLLIAGALALGIAALA